MTIILVSGKNQTGLDKWNFIFFVNQNDFNLYFRHILNFVGVLYAPITFCFCLNLINVHTSIKTHFVEYNRDLFKILRKTWKKNGSFFQNFLKIAFFQIKRSAVKWKLTIKIYFLVKHEHRFCEQKEAFSSLFGSLFSELQPFQLDDSQLGLEVF